MNKDRPDRRNMGPLYRIFWPSLEAKVLDEFYSRPTALITNKELVGKITSKRSLDRVLPFLHRQNMLKRIRKGMTVYYSLNLDSASVRALLPMFQEE